MVDQAQQQDGRRFLAGALHVAGHAVLCYLLRLPFDSLILGILSEDGAVYGEVRQTDAQRDALRRAQPDAIVTMLQGGLAAETIAAGRGLIHKRDVAPLASDEDADFHQRHAA